MFVDRTAWGRLVVTGADRVRFLHGLSTVNVEALVKAGPGAHGWGALLNPKGRVLAVIDVAVDADGDGLRVWTEPSRGEFVLAHFERYAVMDDVTFTPASGPAYAVWPDVAAVWTAPLVEGIAPGPLADADDEERFRIAAGFVRYGVDVSDDNFPFETPLAGFLDYGKGCYVGQEPVFRVHSQGQTARTLRGVRLAAGATVAPGDVVRHPARPEAGKVTSVAATGDGVVALAYLHRTAATIGDAVTINDGAGTVAELPLA